MGNKPRDFLLLSIWAPDRKAIDAEVNRRIGKERQHFSQLSRLPYIDQRKPTPAAKNRKAIVSLLPFSSIIERVRHTAAENTVGSRQ